MDTLLPLVAAVTMSQGSTRQTSSHTVHLNGTFAAAASTTSTEDTGNGYERKIYITWELHLYYLYPRRQKILAKG